MKQIITLILCVFLASCSYFDKYLPKAKVTPTPPPPPKQHVTMHKAPQAKPVDTAAQQKYYDLGLKYYTEEKYAEAQKAWQQVIQIGAKTALADKAREYLKKVDQVLKTLNEIGTK